jgi:transcriptional regulator with XRE-family HTH domain
VIGVTLGQKLKNLRIEKDLTQKGLAEQLNVSFQTISKWENDENEPDITTLKTLTKIYGCSYDYLFEDGNKDNKTIDDESEIVLEQEKNKISTCCDCGKELLHNDIVHNIERRTSSGIKEMVTICDACFKKHEEEIDRRTQEVEDSMKAKPSDIKKDKGIFHKITDRNDKKPLIWAIIFGILSLVVTLIICLVNYESVGIVWTICAPLIIGYTFVSTIYCIFTASYVSDVFMEVSSWSIRFPGLIFSWNLDGFIWLIAMKILFLILGFLFGVAVFLLALGLSVILSVFSFVPLLIYNKTHY